MTRNSPILVLKDVDGDGGPRGFLVGLQDLKSVSKSSDCVNPHVPQAESW